VTHPPCPHELAHKRQEAARHRIPILRHPCQHNFEVRPLQDWPIKQGGTFTRAGAWVTSVILKPAATNPKTDYFDAACVANRSLLPRKVARYSLAGWLSSLTPDEHRLVAQRLPSNSSASPSNLFGPQPAQFYTDTFNQDDFSGVPTDLQPADIVAPLNTAAPDTALAEQREAA